MRRDKKRDRSIKDIPVTKLLDEFTDMEPEVRVGSGFDEAEYVSMMLKKEAKRKLERMRKDPLTVDAPNTSVEESEEIPEIPEGSCPSCYYCTLIRRIGQSAYCVCTNPERVVDGMYYDHRMWVRSELDLVCHRDPPLRNVRKLLRQHMEERQIQGPNPHTEKPPEKKDSTRQKPEIMNLFGELLEPVEEEPAIVDPKIPELKIRPSPPDIRKKRHGPIVNELELPDEVIEDPRTDLRNETADNLFREEVIAIHKHRALETLKKYRREKTPDLKRSDEVPVISEKFAPMRKCETCYFCANSKKVGGATWCHCTNISRSAESNVAASWVRSRLNPPCWRRCEPF